MTNSDPEEVAALRREREEDARRPRFYVHRINYTQQEDVAERKRFPWHGRVFFNDRRGRREGSVEWNLLKAARSTMFKIGPQKLYVGIWGLFCLYITPPFRIWFRRECELYWYEGDLVWTIFGFDSWSEAGERDELPRWRKGRFTPKDSLFGRPKYSCMAIEQRAVLVPMPEGTYPGIATRSLATWVRPRWPWWPLRLELMRVQIDCEIGIPHDGKGENSWDCGEDATYSITCPAKTIEEGIGHLVASKLTDRKRYGKSNPGAYPRPDVRAAKVAARREEQEKKRAESAQDGRLDNESGSSTT